MNYDIDDLNFPNSCYFKGTIKVFSFLWIRDRLEPQENVRVKLFKEGCATPIMEGRTDSNGELVFDGLDKGKFRVKAEINEKHFHKPIYKPSERVNLGPSNASQEVAIVNRLRREHHEHCHHDHCNEDFISDELLIIILLLFLCGGFC